jgi:hypothetical protein
MGMGKEDVWKLYEIVTSEFSQFYRGLRIVSIAISKKSKFKCNI